MNIQHDNSSNENSSEKRVAPPIPISAGLGLKPVHYEEILRDKPDLGWFEVHPENYMGDGGPPHKYLEAIRNDYPLSLHGVGLSIGGAGRLNKEHLQRLKTLERRYQPGLFSEHLAWSSHDETYLNDLLPLPLTKQTLDIVCDHVDEVHEFIGRQMLLENPSTYIRFDHNDMDEVTFLSEVSNRTGCGLLLDVNNVFVSATNHDFDPKDYLMAFPMEKVGEIHLAGHATDKDDTGAPLLIDAHDREVCDPVWQLYETTIARTDGIPTLIEWDTNIPEWSILFAQAQFARNVMMRAVGKKNSANSAGGHALAS